MSISAITALSVVKINELGSGRNDMDIGCTVRKMYVTDAHERKDKILSVVWSQGEPMTLGDIGAALVVASILAVPVFWLSINLKTGVMFGYVVLIVGLILIGVDVRNG